MSEDKQTSDFKKNYIDIYAGALKLISEGVKPDHWNFVKAMPMSNTLGIMLTNELVADGIIEEDPNEFRMGNFITIERSH